MAFSFQLKLWRWIIILIETWCKVFLNQNKNGFCEMLESIRPIISVASKEDIAVFNYWAKKVQINPIEESES